MRARSVAFGAPSFGLDHDNFIGRLIAEHRGKSGIGLDNPAIRPTGHPEETHIQIADQGMILFFCRFQFPGFFVDQLP